MKDPSPYRRGIRADMARGFQGPQRGLMVLIWIDIIVLLALCVLCVIGFVNADDTRSQLIFGVFFLAFFMALGMLKTGYFQRLDRLAILDALEEIRERQTP